MQNHYFSHVHASVWLGMEQCSNWRQNLVPDESGPRYGMTHIPEAGTRRNGVDYGPNFCSMCHWPKMSKFCDTDRSLSNTVIHAILN